MVVLPWACGTGGREVRARRGVRPRCGAPRRAQAGGAPPADRAGEQSAEHGEADRDRDDRDGHGGVQHDLGGAAGRRRRAGRRTDPRPVGPPPPAIAGSACDVPRAPRCRRGSAR